MKQFIFLVLFIGSYSVFSQTQEVVVENIKKKTKFQPI